MKHYFLSLCALFLFSACAPHILVVTDEAGVPVGNAFVIRTARPSFFSRKSITVTDSNGIAEVSPVHLTVGKPGFLPNSCSGQDLVTTCQLARITAVTNPYVWVGSDDLKYILHGGTNCLPRARSALWPRYDAYILELYRQGFYDDAQRLGYLELNAKE